MVRQAGEVKAGRRRSALLNWRLYRLALVPVALVVVIGAFALGSRPAPMHTTLASDAFEGSRAMSLLRTMVSLAPERRPGGEGDARLLSYLERWLQSTGGPGNAGYAISKIVLSGQTAAGARRMVVLVGRRPGSTLRSPIVLAAHRDFFGDGGMAQLSGTAVLLEVASILAKAETTHPVEVVFSDGGSAGGAGTAAYAGRREGRADAAIVLGDLAGETVRRPLVQPFSAALGSAPAELERTVSNALGGHAGLAPGAPSLGSQLAHLAFPMTVGEQGILLASGIPAVMVSLAGERGAGPSERVSEQRLESAGRAVLSAFYALDGGPEVPRRAQADLTLGSRVVPGWVVRLLVAALLLGPLALAVDGVARARGRGEPVGRRVWLALSFALPLFGFAVTVKVVAAAGLIGAPPGAVPSPALSYGAGPLASLGVAILVMALCWWAWWRSIGKAVVAAFPSFGAVGVVALALEVAAGVVVWIVNPYTALLLVPALHLWPLALCPRRRPGRLSGRLAIVAGPSACLGLVVLYYALSLGLGPGAVVMEGMAMLAGGHVTVAGALLWSVVLGLALAVAVAAAAPLRRTRRPGDAGGASGRRLERGLARADPHARAWR